MSESKAERVTGQRVTGESEVVDICPRPDPDRHQSTTGTSPGRASGSRPSTWPSKLAEVGLEPQIFESAQGRASTVARIEGEDRSRPARC